MNIQYWTRTVIRGILCTLGIIGNNWLAVSFWPKSTSQLRTSDILFLSLSVSNLITNLLVDIPDIMDFVNNFPEGSIYCSSFVFCSELSESSSIITTMFITIYWHQKLVGSIKYGGAPAAMDNIRQAAAMLAGSWTTAFVFNIPRLIYTSNEISDSNLTFKECAETYPSPEFKQAYEIMYVVLVNLVPVIGILTASIQITSTLLQNEKRIKVNVPEVKVKNAPPEDSKPQQGLTGTVAPKPQVTKSSSSSKSLLRAVKSVLAVATIFLICWVIHSTVTIIGTFKDSILIMELASYIGAFYTNIIPYMYLHGVKKFACCCTDR